ncbi:MAG TPA: TetR/AcrR family transcriptional regulator [Chitinophagaceae bacterium]|nr:TetR/AcrR family transcriptional regulator [Chitinophagaceae bacterium]
MAKEKTIKPVKDASAEEKIKEAARKLFTQKGYDAVKTRDIAEEAGINLALLNYYFRSKEKLFDMIVIENMQQFVQTIILKISESNISIAEKVEKVVIAYIDMITANPYLPMFVMNQLHNVPSELVAKMEPVIKPVRNNFLKQLEEAMERGEIAQIKPFHFMANLVGLTIFPFIGKPLLQRVSGVSDEEFKALMQERKKLVPIWIKAILAPK